MNFNDNLFCIRGGHIHNIIDKIKGNDKGLLLMQNPLLSP
jgi:hypothetical protein